jgi:hypothetical protein
MLQAAVAGVKSDRARFMRVAMPVVRRSASRPVLPVYALVVACVVAIANSAAAQTKLANEQIELDIPVQPLGAAISRYGNATGRDVLYDANLACGRLSSEVRGALAPDEALKKLLAGTGLEAELVTGKTFVLLPVPASPQSRQTSSPEHRHYYGLIQAGITDALCEAPGAHPGRYRFTAKLWIAPDGAVVRSRRIGSTGTPQRDHEIDAALRRVQLNKAPPPGFQQPVIILIVPQGPGVTRGCDRS